MKHSIAFGKRVFERSQGISFPALLVRFRGSGSGSTSTSNPESSAELGKFAATAERVHRIIRDG